MAAEIDKAFAGDILKGLQQDPKRLSSKYFYDETGDKLFQQIMKLPEYYLTRCETEILSSCKEDIVQTCCGTEPFRLVDLGAGDGSKTSILIGHFLTRNISFEYVPVDISVHAIEMVTSSLKQKFPKLQTKGMNAEYFSGLKELSKDPVGKIVLFLGSNLGNFSRKDAVQFLKSLCDSLNPGDYLLIGLDLKKDPQVILNAYNDAQGVTAEFNLNLLDRINSELDGNFDRNRFNHYATYDPLTGEVKSYLISQQDQEVQLNAVGAKVHFRKWEAVHTEYSNKYSLDQVFDIAKEAGFTPEKNFLDSKGWFVDSLWRVEGVKEFGS